MFELCSLLCLKLYSLNFAIAQKKIVMLIRIRQTCVALLHKKTREYYINITFPDWVIVENIPRNVIITFPEMIFSTIPQSENVIFILLYRILDHLFSTVLCLPW